MVRGIPNSSVLNIGHAIAPNGRMSLPVDRSSLIYSHFKHVSGIPASEGTQGVTISKLNLLDVLIGRLNQVSKDGASAAAWKSNGTMDSLDENFTSQIRQAKTDNAASPYLPSNNALQGMLFNLKT